MSMKDITLNRRAPQARVHRDTRRSAAILIASASHANPRDVMESRAGAGKHLRFTRRILKLSRQAVSRLKRPVRSWSPAPKRSTGQCEEEGRPLIDRSLGPDLPTMPLNNLADIR